MGGKFQLALVDPDKAENLVPAEVGHIKQINEKTTFAAMGALSQYDFIKVLAYKQLYYRTEKDIVYQKASPEFLQELAVNCWKTCGWLPLPKNIDDTVKMMWHYTDRKAEKPSLDIIMVSEHIYWDRANGELTPSAEGQDIFYRLFNTVDGSKHIVKVPPFTPAQEKVLWDMYAKVKEELQAGKKDPERFAPLKVWANGNHDIYLDLHRAHAYMFLKKKPLGSYLLIGPRRNGKSAYTGMTHTILGEKNTSAVQLGKLNDWHENHDLVGTLMNAPDEEDDAILDHAAMFKTMADHGKVRLPTMASHVGVELSCDFMAFFPMNHIPDWRGGGAGACVKRSLIIPFNADLSKIDNANDDFAEKTFTADFMAEYLGSVFAYAWYYHRHPMVFSDTMLRYQESYEEDLNSGSIYKVLFEKYFDGFAGINLLYDDYQYWCKENEVKMAKKKDLKLVFNEYTTPERTSMRFGDKVVSVNRVPKPDHFTLYEGFTCPELKMFKRVKELHESHMSAVTVLENAIRQKEAEGVVRESRR